jgi:ABC-type transport system substrate-binding protein
VTWLLVLSSALLCSADTPRQGGTLVYGLETEPGVLDPHIFGPWAMSRVVMHIFDALVTFDTTTGSPRPPIVGQLAQPFSDFLAYLADKQQPSAMISPTAIKKYGNEGIAQHLIGTGPFKVVEQVPGEKVVFKRFDGYWGQKPYLNRVIIRPIPDPASRVLALQTGEADVITIPPPDSKEQLLKQGFTWLQGDVHHIWDIPLNHDNEYMQHKKVRQAMNYAVDKNIDTMLAG